MSASSFFRDVGKQVKANSPELLTAIGVTGVFTTSYLAAKATFTVAQDEDADPNASNTDKIKRYWRLYIPAGLSGLVTVGSIVGASHASGRRTAAAVTAFSVTERAFTEYKEKIVDQIGTNQEQKARDEIVQAQVLANPPSRQIIFSGSGHVLCCEMYTNRYFRSDMETLKKAQNEINERTYSDMYVMLSEFYDLIGLPHTSHSDYVGWDADRELALEFSAVMSEGASPEPCMGFYYNYVKPLN